MLRTQLAVCLLLASAPRCADLFSLAANGFSVPTLEAKGAAGTPDPGGMRVAIDFAATNPNKFPLTLDSVDYQVLVEGEQVFAGTQDGLTVSQKGAATVNVQGVVPLSAPVLKKLHAGDTAGYTLQGTVHVETPAGVPADVEFATSGTFVVPGGIPAQR